MNTRIVSLSEIGDAVALLLQGEPVAFPTETVYGLGAPLFNQKAILKIFEIKQRPADNPLIAHVASVEEACSLALDPPPAFFRLAEKFWPGPLSFVLVRNEIVPKVVSAGQQTIAIRMPSHPAALQLIREVGQPLAAPSANLSGRPSPTRASDVWEDLQGRVVLILDGGNCRIGIESTVLDLSGSRPVLLRPGSVSREEIAEVLSETVALPAVDGPILSPGMKYRHYAPKAEVRLVLRREDLRGPFILSPQPERGERQLCAKTLYAEFREADRIGVVSIEIDCASSVIEDAALLNRLVKAACCEPLFHSIQCHK